MELPARALREVFLQTCKIGQLGIRQPDCLPTKRKSLETTVKPKCHLAIKTQTRGSYSANRSRRPVIFHAYLQLELPADNCSFPIWLLHFFLKNCT